MVSASHLRPASVALLLLFSCIEADAIEPFDPGSLVMVRFDGGNARVVKDGEIVEECDRPRDVDTVQGIAATPDGFVLESFRDGEPDSHFRSTIAKRGLGCAREVKANFSPRQLGAIAFDPEGRLWANDSFESELVRLDLERGVIDRALPIPVDHVLADIGIDGTFYLRAFGQNLLPVSPDGEMLSRWSVPAQFAVVAPDCNLLVSSGVLREFTPFGDLIRVIIGAQDPYSGLTPFTLESTDVLWHFGYDPLDSDIRLLVRRRRSGEILGAVAMEAFPGFNFLTHVPPARSLATGTPTPTASPTPTSTQPATASPTAQFSESGCHIGSGGSAGPSLVLLLLTLRALTRPPRGRASRRASVCALVPLVTSLVLTSPSAEAANTYYVNCDPSRGNNSNPGTSAAPWLGIARAVNPAQATHAVGGDTVVVQQGPCNISNVVFGSSLSRSGNCVANPAECTVIRGQGMVDVRPGTDNRDGFIIAGPVANLRIENFRFVEGESEDGSDENRAAFNEAVTVRNGSTNNVVLRNLRIEGAHRVGVRVIGGTGADNILLEDVQVAGSTANCFSISADKRCLDSPTQDCNFDAGCSDFGRPVCNPRTLSNLTLRNTVATACGNDGYVVTSTNTDFQIPGIHSLRFERATAEMAAQDGFDLRSDFEDRPPGSETVMLDVQALNNGTAVANAPGIKVWDSIRIENAFVSGNSGVGLNLTRLPDTSSAPDTVVATIRLLNSTIVNNDRVQIDARDRYADIAIFNTLARTSNGTGPFFVALRYDKTAPNALTIDWRYSVFSSTGTWVVQHSPNQGCDSAVCDGHGANSLTAAPVFAADGKHLLPITPGWDAGASAATLQQLGAAPERAHLFDQDGHVRPLGGQIDIGAFEGNGTDPMPTATPVPPTATRTWTPTQTPTATRTWTPTPTSTRRDTPTSTFTRTRTFTITPTPTPAPCKGDCNDDGLVSVCEINQAYRALFSGGTCPHGGIASVADLNASVLNMVNGCPSVQLRLSNYRSDPTPVQVVLSGACLTGCNGGANDGDSYSVAVSVPGCATAPGVPCVATVSRGPLVSGVWRHQICVDGCNTNGEQVQHQRTLVVRDPSVRADVDWTIFRSVYTVTNTDNGGTNSLRNRLAAATGALASTRPALIRFQPGLGEIRITGDPLLVDASNIVIDGTDATGQPSAVEAFASRQYPTRIHIDPSNKAAANTGNFRITAPDVVLRGLEIRRTLGTDANVAGKDQDLVVFTAPSSAAHTGGSMVSTSRLDGGAGARTSAEDQLVARGKMAVRAAGTNTTLTDPVIVANSEIRHAYDRGVKSTGGTLRVVDSWLHHNLSGGALVEAPEGDLEVVRSILESNGRNASLAIVRASAPQLSVEQADSSPSGARLRSSGNVLFDGPGAGVLLEANARGQVRETFVAAMLGHGIEVAPGAGDPSDPLLFEGNATAYSQRGVDLDTQGSDPESPAAVDFGGAENGGSAGRNAFAGNAVRNFVLRGPEVVSATNNQWEHCGTGSVCNTLSIVAFDLAMPAIGALLVAPEQPHHNPGTLSVEGVQPRKVAAAGDLVAVTGRGFNAIDAILADPTFCSDPDPGYGCCNPLWGTCVEIEDPSTAQWLPAHLLAVTPTHLVVRSPVSCSQPVQGRVRREVSFGETTVAFDFCRN